MPKNAEPAPVTVRPANLGDIPVLACLLGELFAQEHDFTPDSLAQMRGLSMLFDLDDKVRILAAVRSGTVIGMAVLHYGVSTALGGRVATLEDVVVTKDARGTGAGKALMAAVIEQARADGAQRITLLTDHDNAIGQAFYRSFGFERSGMVPFRRMLSRTLAA